MIIITINDNSIVLQAKYIFYTEINTLQQNVFDCKFQAFSNIIYIF